MESTIATLSERVANLSGRIVELATIHRETDAEFKEYRHEIRGELHQIGLELERAHTDRATRGRELELLHLAVDGLVARVSALETVKVAAVGGISVARALLGAAGAVILIVLAWGLGRYAG